MLVVAVFRAVVPLLLCVSPSRPGILVVPRACVSYLRISSMWCAALRHALIGAAVDYGLTYCARVFLAAQDARCWRTLMRRCAWAFATSVVGYAALPSRRCRGFTQMPHFRWLMRRVPPSFSVPAARCMRRAPERRGGRHRRLAWRFWAWSSVEPARWVVAALIFGCLVVGAWRMDIVFRRRAAAPELSAAVVGRGAGRGQA